MGWIKLDDNFFSNKKIVTLSKEAKLMHLAALCYAGANLSDGVVPLGAVRIIAAQADVSAPHKLITELKKTGLWLDHESGYVIHDYLKHNTSLAEVQAKREAARLRAEKRRKGEQGEKFTESSQKVRANNSETSQNVRMPETETETETEVSFGGADAPKKLTSTRGTRLPDGFAVTDDMRSWARSEGATDRLIDFETDKFRDYWPAVPGQKGVKLDWDKTWKNWIRKAISDAPAGTLRRVGDDDPYAGRFNPLASMPKDEHDEYMRQLERAMSEAQAQERRGA